jgi:UDP-N-acetylmuramoyl-L-alanyl-D-glutamate--2,6-diaminopimelate ligase
MRVEDLLEGVEARLLQGAPEKVTGVSYDSRTVEPGEAFFCIKGLITDGHLHTGQAVEKGASLLVVERMPDDELPPETAVVKVPDTRAALARGSANFFGRPSSELKLVGVTGTNGKTTTTFLVENIFKKAEKVTGLIGTVENHIGDRVEPVTRTTPESMDLQRLLRRMVDSGVEIAVMEVSSHALELHRVDACDFDVVVFTNLTQDHLDFHISLEEYFGAKRRLFEGGEFGEDRIALINIDDGFGRRLLEETQLPTRSYGLDPGAKVRASDIEVSSEGNRFKLDLYGEEMPVSTRLQGRFNVYNCVSAAGAAYELDAGSSSILSGLESLHGVPGRFENIDCGQSFTVIVDYAHTPDGVRSLLEACREVSGGRVMIVVGCGGDRDRSKRPLMGAAAAEISDRCIFTSDNPRGEDPGSIIEMILEGVRGRFPPEKYMVEVDRREAIRKAFSLAEPGDLVVIAGKGHESGQIFADGVIPFDDRQVARECLKEVPGAVC